MKRKTGVAGAMVLGTLLSCLCSAEGAVGSHPEPESPEGAIGHDFAFQFVLDGSSTDFAGMSGEMTFDPDVLESPRVVTADASSGFVVMSMPMAPGRIRFAAYRNPLTILSLPAHVLEFRFHVRETAEEGESLVEFPVATAGSVQGQNLSSVAFDDVTVNIVSRQKTAVGPSWTLYE